MNMFGLYLVLGILVAAVLLVGYAAVRPKLKRYRLSIKRIEPRKKKRAKPAKKRKAVWLRIA
jgi:hypothetical protein